MKKPILSEFGLSQEIVTKFYKIKKEKDSGSVTGSCICMFLFINIYLLTMPYVFHSMGEKLENFMDYLRLFFINFLLPPSYVAMFIVMFLSAALGNIVGKSLYNKIYIRDGEHIFITKHKKSIQEYERHLEIYEQFLKKTN